jgi:hypothetical protein
MYFTLLRRPPVHLHRVHNNSRPRIFAFHLQQMLTAKSSLSTQLLLLCVFCAGTDAFLSTPVMRFPRAAYVRRSGALCLSMQNQVETRPMLQCHTLKVCVRVCLGSTSDAANAPERCPLRNASCSWC